MKSFFYCEICKSNDSLIFSISQHCELCDMNYDLWCENCKKDIQTFSPRELKNYILELEMGMKILK